MAIMVSEETLRGLLWEFSARIENITTPAWGDISPMIDIFIEECKKSVDKVDTS